VQGAPAEALEAQAGSRTAAVDEVRRRERALLAGATCRAGPVPEALAAEEAPQVPGAEAVAPEGEREVWGPLGRQAPRRSGSAPHPPSARRRGSAWRRSPDEVRTRRNAGRLPCQPPSPHCQRTCWPVCLPRLRRGQCSGRSPVLPVLRQAIHATAPRRATQRGPAEAPWLGAGVCGWAPRTTRASRPVHWR
jgi:hypothetical protein